MNNSYITIIKEKRTVLSRKRVPLNQNECTANFRIGVPFEQNLQLGHRVKDIIDLHGFGLAYRRNHTSGCVPKKSEVA